MTPRDLVGISDSDLMMLALAYLLHKARVPTFPANVSPLVDELSRQLGTELTARVLAKAKRRPGAKVGR